MSKKDPYHPALSSSSSFSSSSSTSSSPSFVSSSSSSSSSSSVCRCSPCRCSPCQHSTCPRFSVSSCSSPPISSSSSNSGRRSINLQPFNNYLVCWVGKGLGSGVIRFVKGEMRFDLFEKNAVDFFGIVLISTHKKNREVIPLEAGHMYVTPLGGEDSSKVFDDDITSYLSERIYGGFFFPPFSSPFYLLITLKKILSFSFVPLFLFFLSVFSLLTSKKYSEQSH